MSFRSGIDAQAGFIQETTWNTYSAPTIFLPFESESIKNSIARIEGKDLQKSNFIQRTDRWAPGRQSVAGDMQFILGCQGFATPLYMCLGAFASVADVSGTHYTFTPGDLHGKSMAIQVGRPGLDGTVKAFSYTGCKVDSWDLSNTSNDQLRLKMTIDGAKEDTTQTLAAASFPSAATYENFYFTQGAITIAGSPIDVLNWNVSGKNAMKTDRYYISSTTPAQKREQERNAYSDYTGSLAIDYTSDLAAYNRFVNGTLATGVFTYTGLLTHGTAAPNKLVVTIQNMRFDGDTPNVSGPDVIAQNLPYVALYDGTNPAVKVEYFTAETTTLT